MSLANLSSAIGDLQFDPTFNMGLGLMAASGPSLVPHSFGQDLAGGMQYAQAAREKSMQAQLMNYQMQQAALNNQMLRYATRMQQGGGSTGNGDFATPDQARAATANLGAPSTNAGDAPALASANGTAGTSYADPQAATQQSGQQGNYDPMSSYLRTPQGAMQFVLDKKGFFDHVAPAPTDFQKMLIAANIDPISPQGQQLIKANLAKQNYIAPPNSRPGSIIRDPITMRPLAFNPNVPAGGTPVFDASGNVVGINQIPGAAGVAGAMEAARTAGAGSQLPYSGFDAKGNPLPVTNRTAAANQGIPAPMRNNNPGAVSPGGRVASYPDMQTGLAEMDKNLASYAGKPDAGTLADVISKWVGSPENAPAYVADVSRRLGIPPDAPVDLNNPAQRQAIGTAIMLHENGPAGVFHPAGSPVYATQPLGAKAASDAAQGAPSKQMAESYGSLSDADASYQQSREALLEMLHLAQNKGIAGSAVGLLPSSVATRFSPDAATYQKLHAQYVALQGKALGSGGTDASRETINEAVPTYEKPQPAMLNGLKTQLNNLDMQHIKAQFLNPIYNQGDEKAYTHANASFDQNVTPAMVPILRLSGSQQAQAVAQAIKQDPTLKARFEWAYNNGLLK